MKLRQLLVEEELDPGTISTVLTPVVPVAHCPASGGVQRVGPIPLRRDSIGMRWGQRYVRRDRDDADDTFGVFGREPEDPWHGVTVRHKNRTVQAGSVQHGGQVSGDLVGRVRLFGLRTVGATGTSSVDDCDGEPLGEGWSDHLPRPPMRNR